MMRVELTVPGEPVAQPRTRSTRPAWSDDEVALLVANYPLHGKAACIALLGRSEHEVRRKAAALGLRLDRTGPFWHDFQERAAKTKVGRKRPGQADVVRRLHREGKLKKTVAQRAIASANMRFRIASQGHHRGMLGKRHSAETKRRIGKASAAIWSTVTDEQIGARYMKARKTMERNGTTPVYNREKATWKAGWRNIGGKKKYYRSRWEANYARYLEWLKQQAAIAGWSHEPKTFWFEGIKRGCVSYLPDFRVDENDGSETYHEVKGWMDDRSKTKIKRMAKYHPKVKLIVIDGKQYKALAKQVSAFVPGWE